MKRHIARILGARVQSTAEIGIAGLKDTKNTEIVFFEVPIGSSPRQVFKRLTTAVKTPTARDGGAAEYGCAITTPDAVVYHSLQTHMDVDGWKKDIEFGAAQNDLCLGKVKRQSFIVDGCRRYPLSECLVEFF